MSNDDRYLAEIKRLNYLLVQSRNETSNAIQRAEGIQRDKVSDMQKFIDTLPDGLRGAWSMYLMMKKDKESEDE